MSSRTAARTRPAGSKRQCARAAGRGISHQRQVRLAVHLQILTQSSLSIRCFCDLNVSPPRYSGGHWFVSHLLAPQSAEQVGYAGRGGRAAIPGPIGANRSNFHSGLVPCARSVPLVSARQTFAIGRQCDLNEAVGLIAGGRPVTPHDPCGHSSQPCWLPRSYSTDAPITQPDHSRFKYLMGTGVLKAVRPALVTR
jgi:hypothetical protein